MKSGLKENKVIMVVLVYLCGCSLSKFAHAYVHVCSLVNFKSPSSHGYHYVIKIREEKRPLRLHRHITETTP